MDITIDRGEKIVITSNRSDNYSNIQSILFMKHYFRFPILLIVLSWLSSSLNGQGSIYDYTPENLYPELRAVLKEAETNALGYQNLDYSLAEARINNRLARTNNRPSVGLSTGGGFFASSFDNGRDDDPNTPEDETIESTAYQPQFGINDLNLGLSYTIYQWGAKRANHRIADKSFENYLIGYKQSVESFAQDIRVQFMQLIIQKFNQRSLNLQIEIAQDNIAQEAILYEEGKISDDNYTRLSNSRKMFILDLEQTKRYFDRALEDFRKVTGVQNFNESQIPTNIPQVEINNNQFISLANQTKSQDFADLTSIQQAKISVDIAEESIITTQAGSRPSLFAYAGSNFDVEATEGNERIFEYYGGLRLGWTIYNGGATQMNMRKAYSRRVQRMVDLEDAKLNASIGLERQLVDLDYRLRRLEIGEADYQLALQNYEKSKDEYARGRMSDIQFKQVENQRLNEEQAVYSRRRDYIVQVSNFLRFIGKDPIFNVLTLPENKDLSHLKTR